MTTSLPEVLGQAWQRWCRFWVKPGDPTTMALLRIIAGSLCFYVHLIYSFDLFSFFGKNAWFDLELANRTRREEPNRYPSFEWDHQNLYTSVVMPESTAMRKTMVDWIRSMPGDSDGLKNKLRLIDTEGMLNKELPPVYPRTNVIYNFEWFAIEHTLVLSPDPKLRADALEAIRDKTKRDRREAIPEVFDLLQPNANVPVLKGMGTQNYETMDRFLASLEAFYSTLPKGDSNQKARRYIVTYLQELPAVAKNNLLILLRETRDGQPLATERDAELDYLEYWGIDRRSIKNNGRFGSPIFSFWYHITDPPQMIAMHVAVLVVMLMFTLGLFTRVTSVLTWLAAVSYIHRNPMILFGQDTMMNILLIYLMIARCGATLSLDRLIERYRVTKASLKRTGTIDGPTALFLNNPPLSMSSHFANRMLQVHFCFIYMASGLSKLKGGTWWNTSEAMWMTLVNPEFTMIHFEWYRELARWAFSSRPFFGLFAAIGVGYTLFVEISLPYLVWTRLRPWIVILGFGLHFGIGVFMGLLVFSLFMMTMLASYIPGWAIREFLFGKPLAETEKTKVSVDAKNDAEVNKQSWAVAMDRTGKLG
jgi:hypothetical protein